MIPPHQEEIAYCGEPLQWFGLYQNDQKFKPFISPDTFAHPAKMSMRLAEYIILHLEKLDLVSKGDRIIDFMAGTARTGIIAELHGYAFTGIELESHFIDMIEKNRKSLKSRIMRDPNWNIIQGDARKLSKVLNGGAALTSPPYGELGLNYRQNGIVENGQKYERPYMQGNNMGYSAIVSPPYSQAEDRYKYPVQDGEISDVKIRQYDCSNHGLSEGQIGNLKDIGIVSPPYESAISKQGGNGGEKMNIGISQRNARSYSDNKDNIGNSETYLSAMQQVYSEAYKAGISPLAIVTKNPTRDGKLRRLDLDTMALLEKVGYMIVDYHQAVLFKEATQKTLFDEEVKQVSGQLSFFKRLHYARGSPTAQWEDIIIAIIPEGPS